MSVEIIIAIIGGSISLIGAVINITITLINIKYSKRSKVLEYLILKRVESLDNINNFFNLLEKQDNFIYDYSKCKLLKRYESQIPSYYVIFEDKEKLIKFKTDLNNLYTNEYSLDFKISWNLFIIKSFIDNVILFYNINKGWMNKYPQTKIFISLELQLLILKLRRELNRVYSTQKFEEFNSIPKNSKKKYESEKKRFKKMSKTSFFMNYIEYMSKRHERYIVYKNKHRKNNLSLNEMYKYKKNRYKNLKLRQKLFEKQIKQFRSCNNCKELCIMNKDNRTIS